jgi:hypothetical protein
MYYAGLLSFYQIEDGELVGSVGLSQGSNTELVEVKIIVMLNI